MRALIKYDSSAGAAEIREVPNPELETSDEIKIQVKLSGICGTDIKVLHGLDKVYKPPVIMGHECAGVVTEVGEKVHAFKSGDFVAIEPTAHICGHCRYCRAGDYNLCIDRKIAGFNEPGSFAEYMVRNEHFVHKLPDTVSLEVGSVLEPIAVSVHAVLERSTVRPGDIVLVTGPGAIGLLVLQVAKLSGSFVVVVGTQDDKDRLQIARSIGADTVIVLEKDEKKNIDKVYQGCGKREVDIAFECSGAEAAANLCLDSLRKRGQYIQLGIFTRGITLDFDKMSYKELSLIGSISQKHSAWEKSIDLLKFGKININPLISAVLPMTHWKQAFKSVEESKAIKVLLQPEL